VEERAVLGEDKGEQAGLDLIVPVAVREYVELFAVTVQVNAAHHLMPFA
jgi:hypothetical protein